MVLAFVAYIGWRFYDSGQFTARKWEWLQYAQVQRDLANAVLSDARRRSPPRPCSR